MKFLLDTNAYSALRRGNSFVAERVRRAEGVLLSAIVLGELLYGFRHGSRFESNHQDLQEFLQTPGVEVLPVTSETADHFGRIAASLRKRGTPIPSNDMWIAAHALEAKSCLLSSDPHFRLIQDVIWVPFSQA